MNIRYFPPPDTPPHDSHLTPYISLSEREQSPMFTVSGPYTESSDHSRSPLLSPFYSFGCDSPLPTSISGASSPSSAAKETMVQPYPQQATPNSSQQPTPPETSRQPYNSHWDFLQPPTSQPPSPMSAQPQTAAELLDIHSYQMDHEHTSPEDALPRVANPTPYYGNFGVSATSEPPESFFPMFTGVPVDVEPTSLVKQERTSESHPLLPSMRIPMHGQPRLSAASSSGYHNNQMYVPSPQPAGDNARLVRQIRKAPPRGAGVKKQRLHSTKLLPIGPGGRDSSPIHQLGLPTPSPQYPSGQEIQPERLTFTEDCPEEDKILYEIRCRYKEDRGKGMWDSITAEYQKKCPAKKKEALQVQLDRGIFKHAIWPDSETKALADAYHILQKEFYSDLATKMAAIGGCKAWKWKEKHLRKRLIELRLEEYEQNETPRRPRRTPKATESRRRSAAAGPSNWYPNQMMYDGTMMRTEPLAARPPMSYIPTRTLTAEQEQEMLDSWSHQDEGSPDSRQETIQRQDDQDDTTSQALRQAARVMN